MKPLTGTSQNVQSFSQTVGTGWMRTKASPGWLPQEIHWMPIERREFSSETNSASKWSRAGQGGVRLAIQEQIELLGSEALLNRLEKAFKIIEGNLFLYKKQQQLYTWREKVLKESITWMYDEQVAFLATQCFYRVLQKLESTPDSEHRVDRLRIVMDIGKRAFILFQVPLIAVRSLNELHLEECTCQLEECYCHCQCYDCRKIVDFLRRLLPRHYPHDTVLKATDSLVQACNLTELYIRNYLNYRLNPQKLVKGGYRK